MMASDTTRPGHIMYQMEKVNLDERDQCGLGEGASAVIIGVVVSASRLSRTLLPARSLFKKARELITNADCTVSRH